jgi:hypothetical protein
MQELINAASAGQNILGIFTSKNFSLAGHGAKTIDVKSRELLHGRKLTAKERYLGTGKQLKWALVFLAFCVAEYLFLAVFPDPWGDMLGAAIPVVGAIIFFLMGFLKGSRKFPDILIITEHDLVVLTGIQWNKDDGLHKFGGAGMTDEMIANMKGNKEVDGIRILRSHAKIKTTLGQVVISVASAEKGLLGSQKSDVVVNLKQSSTLLRKEKKILGDQLVNLKQAKELWEASPAQPIST